MNNADNLTVSRPPGILRFSQLLVRGLIAGLLFLAPLKFGTVINTGAISFYPVSVWEWLLSPWPGFLVAGLGGTVLLLAVLVYPCPRLPMRHWLYLGVWAGILVCALPGLYRTTELEAAALFLWHLLSILALVAAVLWVLPHDPVLRGWLLVAVSAGTLLVLIGGWHDVYGGGMQRTLEFAEEQAAGRGETVSEAMRSRLTEGRASSTFVYPNSYGAHLVLTLPLFLVLVWRWAGYFTPVRFSRGLFVPLSAFLGVGGLLFSGSRAALVAFGGGVVFTILVRFRRAWMAWALSLLMVVMVTGGIVMVNQGRTLSSLEARIGYARAGLIMLAEQPLTGVGLGEFFPHYIRLKKASQEDTRLPHNVFILFAAQAGVAGAVGAGLVLALPFITGRRGPGGRKKRPAAEVMTAAVLTGMAAWVLHALTDFNMNIPGTVLTFSVMPLLLEQRPSAGALLPQVSERRRWWCWLRLVLAALGLLGILSFRRVSGELSYRRFHDALTTPGFPFHTLRQLYQDADRELAHSPYPSLLFAQAAAGNGLHSLAAEAFAEALVRTPHRGAIWYSLAHEQALIGKHAAAQAALVQAIAWAPHDPRRQEMINRVGGLP